jgi:hypothetical protein
MTVHGGRISRISTFPDPSHCHPNGAFTFMDSAAISPSCRQNQHFGQNDSISNAETCETLERGSLRDLQASTLQLTLDLWSVLIRLRIEAIAAVKFSYILVKRISTGDSMARPPMHPFWVERIRVLAANNPRLSGVEIQRKLKNDLLINKNEHPPTPVPSDRSIRRIVAQFSSFTTSQQQPYRYFSWPTSIEAGVVPWEAGRVVLELIRFRIDQKMLPPLIVEAQWFWRVTLAIPEAPISQRAKVAATLAMIALSEQQPQTENLDVLQWLLAYQPWRSKQDRQAYLQAIKERRIPATSDASAPVSLVDALSLRGHYHRTLDQEIFTM